MRAKNKPSLPDTVSARIGTAEKHTLLSKYNREQRRVDRKHCYDVVRELISGMDRRDALAFAVRLQKRGNALRQASRLIRSTGLRLEEINKHNFAIIGHYLIFEARIVRNIVAAIPKRLAGEQRVRFKRFPQVHADELDALVVADAEFN